MTLLFPGSLADFHYNLGNKKMCVWYTEKEYNRRKSVSSLDKLVMRSKWLGSNGKVVKYSELLIADPDFDRLCDRKDEAIGNEHQSGTLVDIAYKDYIEGDYVVALYNTGKVEKAKEYYLKDIADGNYPKYNAFQTLLYEMLDKDDKKNLSDMYDTLNGYVTNLGGEALALAMSDVEIIATYLNI